MSNHTLTVPPFGEWLAQVDSECRSISGCSLFDIADFDSRAVYADETSPREAALDLLEEEGLDLDFDALRAQFEAGPDAICSWCGEPGGVLTADLHGHLSYMHDDCAHQHAVSQVI